MKEVMITLNETQYDKDMKKLVKDLYNTDITELNATSKFLKMVPTRYFVINEKEYRAPGCFRDKEFLELIEEPIVVGSLVKLEQRPVCEKCFKEIQTSYKPSKTYSINEYE